MAFQKRWIVGKTVADVGLGATRVRGGETAFPTIDWIEFSDGSRVVFFAQDIEDCFPETEPIYEKSPIRMSTRQNHAKATAE